MNVQCIFLCLYIRFISTLDRYILLGYRKGSALPSTPVLVTLIIGDNSGSTLMNAKFD